MVFDAILNRQPADPRVLNAQLPEELCRVITRALEKDRRMRYQTAADMLSELGRLRRDTSGRTIAATTVGSQAGHSGVQSTASGVTPPVSGQAPAVRRKTPPVTIAGILAAALAAGAGVWSRADRARRL